MGQAAFAACRPPANRLRSARLAFAGTAPSKQPRHALTRPLT